MGTRILHGWGVCVPEKFLVRFCGPTADSFADTQNNSFPIMDLYCLPPYVFSLYGNALLLTTWLCWCVNVFWWRYSSKALIVIDIYSIPNTADVFLIDFFKMSLFSYCILINAHFFWNPIILCFAYSAIRGAATNFLTTPGRRCVITCSNSTDIRITGPDTWHTIHQYHTSYKRNDDCHTR